MVRAEMTVTKNHVRISQNVVEIHGFQHFAVRAACQTCYRSGQSLMRIRCLSADTRRMAADAVDVLCKKSVS